MATKAAFYQQVDQDFYAQVKKENGGKLPANLTDADGNPRKLTTSAADRGYRQKWNAIAAKDRKSKAVVSKNVDSPWVPCALKAVGAKIPPILLPTKKGGNTVVAAVVGPENAVNPSASAAFGVSAALHAIGAGIVGIVKGLLPDKTPATENYSASVDIFGSPDFRKKTKESLDRLEATPTGKRVLDDIAASGKKVQIIEGTDNNGHCSANNPAAAIMSAGKPGAGSDSVIQFNPSFTPGGVPNEDVLGHELIHAQHNARGIQATGTTDGVNNEELQTVGLPPYKEFGLTENSLRADLRLPKRSSY